MAGQNQNDSTTTTVMIVIAIIILGVGADKIFGNNIMEFFLYLRKLIVEGYLHIFKTEALQSAYDKLNIYTPKEWDYTSFSELSSSLRLYIAPPLLLILIPYGFSVYKKNPFNKYKRILSRKSLCESEVSLWPWIAPVLKLDIISEPIEEGPWAMSDTVLMFCRKYNLLNDKNDLQDDKAKKILISQLGTLWTGIDDLKIHEKAILVCFLAQLNKDTKAALKGMRILSTSIAEGNIDYSFVDDYVRKYAHTERSEYVLSQNAYTYNVIANAFEKCKELGKLPPSYFVWLKVVDRKLFYVLQCVGRQLPFCEVAGSFGHGLAEKVIGRPCINPYVDKGVLGLRKALTLIKID